MGDDEAVRVAAEALYERAGAERWDADGSEYDIYERLAEVAVAAARPVIEAEAQAEALADLEREIAHCEAARAGAERLRQELERERAGNDEARRLLRDCADDLSDEPDPMDGGAPHRQDLYDRVRRYLTDDDPRAALAGDTDTGDGRDVCPGPSPPQTFQADDG